MTNIKNVGSQALPISRETCSDCFRIVCGGCGWEPSGSEVELIQKQIITACPDCGWKPQMFQVSRKI